mmetsp:Transcript_33739/g.81700  ORF Transcript_33739/g.81700 Transcript_33739/m.81700 type:complete len:252 (+) Transcript_33739:77-832(+)
MHSTPGPRATAHRGTGPTARVSSGPRRQPAASSTPHLRVPGLGSSHQLINVLTLLQHLLPLDQGAHTVDEDVHQVGLGLAQTVGVGDVPLAAHRGGVHSRGAAGLQAQLGADLTEILAGRDQRQLGHGPGAQASSQVGRARQDVPQVIVVHEIVALFLQHLLDGGACGSEPLKDGVHIVSLLHGHDAHVILLIQPHKEVLGIIVEDSAGVRPVAAAARRQQERGVRLLEEVAALAEVLFLILGHSSRHQLE